VIPDPIIAGIDPDCCGPAGLVVLKGYLGEGGADGLWRLYRSLTMDEYTLIRDEDIVAQRRVDDESLIWLCGDHVVRWVKVRPAARLQEEFLRGDIVRRLANRQLLDLLRSSGGAGGDGGSGGLDDVDWDGPVSAVRTRCC
jgi:hypothetical protein